MKRRVKWSLVIAAMLGLLCCAILWWGNSSPDVSAARQAGRPARMHPDYAGVIVPANIAPLNFVVDEPGGEYFLRIVPATGKPIEVRSSDGAMDIPREPWRQMLSENRDKGYALEIYVRNGSQWERFQTVDNRVAADDIDGYMAYRLIRPIYNCWLGGMGIYQRNISTFDESPILESAQTRNDCVNCHTFNRNRPDPMILHLRPSMAEDHGPAMLLIRNGKVTKLDTRTPQNQAPAGYASWHPSVDKLAIAKFKPRQFFHTAGPDVREVLDLESDLGMFDVGSQTVTQPAVLAQQDRFETFPCWSPDGKFLYYVQTQAPWQDRENIPFDTYRKAKYDLMRVSYNAAGDKWGKPETILNAGEIGKSASQPRISPDGRWLIFCLADHGTFSTLAPDSDLYIMDLADPNRPYRPMTEINSDRSESWHCWSSNGKWIVFSSKRDTGLFARAYFSHIDADGRAGKPVLLPQKDARFYDRCLDNYNLPELLTGPVTVNRKELVRTAGGSEVTQTRLPMTGATPHAASGPATRDK